MLRRETLLTFANIWLTFNRKLAIAIESTPPEQASPNSPFGILPKTLIIYKYNQIIIMI